MTIVRALLMLALVYAAVAVAAQELTIFDLDDFVDPRLLGAAATSRGRFLCNPCSYLLISRAMVGWNSDYMNVTVPTNVDVAFAHVATSYYRGPWQVNAKFTGLRDVHRPDRSQTEIDSRTVPREAGVLQVAYYHAVGAGEKARAARTEITWRASHYVEARHERRDDRFARVHSDVIRHEFGIEWDVPIPGNMLGSIILTGVAGEHLTLDAAQTRLAYVHRSPRFDIGPVHLDAMVSAGVLGEGLDFGDLRRITIKPAVGLAVPLGRTGINLNVRFAPAFQRRTRFTDDGGGELPSVAYESAAAPSRYIWERSPELAIFIDRSIFRRSRLHGPKPVGTPPELQ